MTAIWPIAWVELAGITDGNRALPLRSDIALPFSLLLGLFTTEQPELAQVLAQALQSRGSGMLAAAAMASAAAILV